MESSEAVFCLIPFLVGLFFAALFIRSVRSGDSWQSPPRNRHGGGGFFVGGEGDGGGFGGGGDGGDGGGGGSAGFGA